MAISFMVLGGPRSATTWAANWLTTDTTLCLHDPLLEYTTERLKRLQPASGKRLGISCTSSLLYPDWLNAQKCPKLVLYRDVKEINRSLRELGLVELIESRHLARIADAAKQKNVMLVPYEYLFLPTAAKRIAAHLGVPFDAERHNMLIQMRIEPLWKRLNVGREACEQLIKRITEAR